MSDEDKIGKLKELVRCLEDLLVCYRLGTRPKDKLLDKINKLKGELS